MATMKTRSAMTRAVTGFIAVVVLVILVDLRQAPGEQWSSRAAISAIHVYQATLSKWYARIGVQCRFVPTCSHYSEECIRRFGAARGGWMAMKRLVRCGPWTPLGTLDPPPT
jgi:putative membrane protein insertion efficiency factor